MRKIALILPLITLFGACSTYTWTGQNSGVSEEAAAMGLKDVATLEREYQNERSWAELRQSMDRRTNALTNGFASIWSTIDRHMFNASAGDPSIDYPTDHNYFTGTISGVSDGVSENVLGWLPIR
ncbi:MAG: hypothetical protein U1F36_09005 [Planctomycetota bacterium]